MTKHRFDLTGASCKIARIHYLACHTVCLLCIGAFGRHSEKIWSKPGHGSKIKKGSFFKFDAKWCNPGPFESLILSQFVAVFGASRGTLRHV